jgi:hypothetical protein
MILADLYAYGNGSKAYEIRRHKYPRLARWGAPRRGLAEADENSTPARGIRTIEPGPSLLDSQSVSSPLTRSHIVPGMKQPERDGHRQNGLVYRLPKYIDWARRLALVSGAAAGVTAGATLFVGPGCHSCVGICGFYTPGDAGGSVDAGVGGADVGGMSGRAGAGGAGAGGAGGNGGGVGGQTSGAGPGGAGGMADNVDSHGLTKACTNGAIGGPLAAPLPPWATRA